MAIRGSGRKLTAPPNPGAVVVWALAGIAVGSFALGFAFRPADSPPGAIPDPPALNLSFQSASPRQLAIYSFLEQQAGASARLAIDADGTFAPGQTVTRWTLYVQGFTGYLCGNAAPGARLVRVPGGPDDYEITASVTIPAASGRAFLAVTLCWASGAPLVVNGAYVSAALAPILVQSGEPGTVTRSLVLSGTSLSSYSLAGGIAPTEVDPRSWIWTDELGMSFEDQARDAIPVIASSLPGIQRDNQDIFYSGILFGIAGGAVVSVIPALLDAADRRKAIEHHEVTP